MEACGRIHSFESFGTLDGPGIRFVVFLQGCPLRCLYCHNPDTWDASLGRVVSVSELVRKVESCRSFIRSGGVTLSGGEPLLQPEFSLALLKEFRRRGFHTALDTAGSLPLEVSRPVVDEVDMLLLDVKALDPELCRRLTGRDNRNELATLAYCEKTGKEVWIRHVLTPGWTLDEGRLRALAEYLKAFRCVTRIDLLPYHRMGAEKWEKLHLAEPLAGVPEPSASECEKAERIFKSLKEERTEP